MAQTSNTNSGKPSSSAPTRKTAPTVSSAMTREELMKKLSSNPRFKPAKQSGTAYVIVGAKPSVKGEFKVEILKQELDEGLDYWLSPKERNKDKLEKLRDQIRKRNRAKYLRELERKTPDRRA